MYLLAEQVIHAAAVRKQRIALAESCTGGLIAAVLTSVAGASEVFMGSAVTYSNEAKENLLGVEKQILDRYGAVSAECAEQMAAGAARIYCATLTVSVTGIAGPGGGTQEKPVGTVWFGCSNGASASSFVRLFGGDRERIRQSTVIKALRRLLKELR